MARRIGLIISLVLLLAASGSLVLDRVGPTPQWLVCRFGGCRIDQYGAATAQELLRLDPSNPFRWADYADATDSASAYERAAVLGPNVPEILVRAANFYFAHGDSVRTQFFAGRALNVSSDFDEILFTYFPPSATFDNPRVALSFLNFQLNRATDEQLLLIWQSLNTRGVVTPEAAARLSWTLWNRHSYSAAAAIQGPGTPFDWNIERYPGVEVSHADGLQIHFLGNENLFYSHARRYAALRPGPHTIVADISTEDLTTNEGPYFEIFDIEASARLDVSSPQFLGTSPRRTVTIPFTVPAATRAICIEVRRNPSYKFDSKISGLFRLHSFSLR